MDEKIIIYGTTQLGFSTKQELIDYLDITLARDEKYRFRYSQCKPADIIILTWKGLAYGHLAVIDKVPPNDEDKWKFDRVKCTYLISDSILYEKPVKLYADLGIRVNQWGPYINRKQFNGILEKSKPAIP